MRKVWYCVLSFLIANLLVESWKDVSDYEHAISLTWSQMWALVIYYFIWEEE